MRHACPPTGLQLVEKLVVICCAHPAAYRDPQRFDAKQLQRCSVGHAALLDSSLPPASHFPHSSGLQTHRLLAHLPMQFLFPPCLRSWYMLMFQSPRVGEVYLRHDGGWVGRWKCGNGGWVHQASDRGAVGCQEGSCGGWIMLVLQATAGAPAASCACQRCPAAL